MIGVSGEGVTPRRQAGGGLTTPVDVVVGNRIARRRSVELPSRAAGGDLAEFGRPAPLVVATDRRVVALGDVAEAVAEQAMLTAGTRAWAPGDSRWRLEAAGARSGQDEQVVRPESALQPLVTRVIIA